MKKALSLVLFFSILFTMSFGLADAVDDFYDFIDNSLYPSFPEGFRSSKTFLMSPLFKQTKSAEEILSDPEARTNEIVHRFADILVTRQSTSADVLPLLFGSYTIEPDLTKPSYIGRDGNILSMYVQGVDCGCFMLYDLTSQKIEVKLFETELIDQIESVLFQRCADGYFIIDASALEEEIAYQRKMLGAMYGL